MTMFEPKNPDFSKAAAAMFEQQPAMHTLGISLVRTAPGQAELAMDYSPALTQQNGFVHAGIVTAALDNACGVAAFTLM
ncbi:MAG: PaaI family thioesterase, partial [Bradyrhizobium guangdongense]